MSLRLQLDAALRRQKLAAEAGRRPERQTWIAGEVTSADPVLVTSMPGKPGRPALNMTNAPLAVGQRVMVMVLDGSVRLVMGAHGSGDGEPVVDDPPDPLTQTQSALTLSGPQQNVGAVTLGSSPTAGRTLVVVSGHRGTVPEVVDTVPSGGGWSLIGYRQFRETNQDRRGVAAWHKVANGSESATVEVDWRDDHEDGTGDIGTSCVELSGPSEVGEWSSADSGEAFVDTLGLGPAGGSSGVGAAMFCLFTRADAQGISFASVDESDTLSGSSISLGVGVRFVEDVAAGHSSDATWGEFVVAIGAAFTLRATG